MSMRFARWMFAAWAVLSVLCQASFGGPFVAYSLREADRRARENTARNDELMLLGGMTRICGIVYDDGAKDVILVGKIVAGQASATLDDLVVALRARLRDEQWPTVSIDPTKDTPRNGLQKVTFLGGLDGTEFGSSFLQSDIVLKEYSLERLQSTSNVPSFRSLFTQTLKERLRAEGKEINRVQWLTANQFAEASRNLLGRPVQDDKSYQCRFWFYPREPLLLQVRGGVFCIKELQLTVEAQITQGSDRKSRPSGRPGDVEKAAVLFSQRFSGGLHEVSVRHPVLKRLKILYDLVAVAQGIRELKAWEPGFLLQRYRLPRVETRRNYEFVQMYGLFERSDGLQHVVHLSGGVQFRTEIKWLNSGNVGRLKDVVLKTRPSRNALSWQLPLEGWDFPNRQDLKSESSGNGTGSPSRSAEDRIPACSLFTRSVVLSPRAGDPASVQRPFRGFSGLTPSVAAFSPGDPTMKCNGVVINPKPVKDPRRLEKNIGKRIRDQRPDRKATHWEIDRPKVEIEDDQ